MKKALAVVLLTSILLRLWFAVGYWANKNLTHDAQEYMELARNFNSTGELKYDEHSTTQIETYGRAPLYPVWLAFLMRIQPNVAWLRLVEVGISLLSTYLFFLIARRMFTTRAGVFAFVLSSFYFPLLWLIPPLLSENLWILMMLFSYWLLLNKTPRSLAAAFIVLSLATLVRPAAVFLLPFYCFWTYGALGVKPLTVSMLLYFAILTPWNLHLYRQEGHFIFVASEGGVTLWTGTHPQYRGEGDLAVNPPVQKDYRGLLQEYASSTSAEREKIYMQKARENILQHPGTVLWIEAKKLAYWILPFGPSILESSRLHQIVGILFYLPVLLIAAWNFRKLDRESKLFAGGIVLSFTLMILLFFPQERFRIATVDPILILIASRELALKYGSVLARF